MFFSGPMAPPVQEEAVKEAANWGGIRRTHATSTYATGLNFSDLRMSIRENIEFIRITI